MVIHRYMDIDIYIDMVIHRYMDMDIYIDMDTDILLDPRGEARDHSTPLRYLLYRFFDETCCSGAINTATISFFTVPLRKIP